MRNIYLDYNATTPVAPAVREAMSPYFCDFFGNPSSGYARGLACREAIEDARAHLARLLGADTDEIIFTSGGTESNNLALMGLMLRSAPTIEGHLVISRLEHPAITEPARFLERLGVPVSVVPSQPDGTVAPEAVEQALRPDTRLVSIMHANNEIGTIQPIRAIAEICHAQGILVHTDAAQSVGKIPLDVDDLDVDLLTVAGHKMYAPKGIGALFVRRGTAMEPYLLGAGQECGLRPGTENVPYIVALGQAAKLCTNRLEEQAETGDPQERLRDRLLEQLRSGSGMSLRVNGEESPRLPNTLNIIFPDVSAAEMLRHTPDLCASTGSACHSTAITVSPTLAAIGLSPEEAHGAVRLSVGWYTTEEDVDRAASVLLEAWERLRH
jgi:cysteine desulfurase